MRRPGKAKSWPILILGVLLVLTGALVRLNDPALFQSGRLTYFDYLQRLAPRDYADLPVRVVDVDERALEAVGQWPWPRDMIAEMTRRLFDMGAAVVAFDMLFVEPDRYSPAKLLETADVAGAIVDASALRKLDNDLIFSRTITDRPVVLGVAARVGGAAAFPSAKAGFVQIGEAPGDGLPALASMTGLAPYLEDAALGIGGINVAPGTTSGVVRRVPTVWRTPQGFIPSLGLEALRLALGESTYVLSGLADVPAAVELVRVGDLVVPTNDAGEIWVRYRRDDPRLYVSAADILGSDASRAAVRPSIEGQIILIGTSAAGLLDIRTTALGDSVPGVSIHAQIIEQVLTGNFLTRSVVNTGLEVLAFVSLGLLLTVVMSLSGPVLSIGAGAVAGAVVLAGSWFAFSRNGVLFDATFPLIGGMVNFSLLAGYQFIAADRDKRRIRRSFAHYVAPEVLDRIETSGHRLSLGGEVRDVTIMFSDIRNFTPLSETLSAEALVSVLNDLFTRLSAEILDEKGTIDKFIGDSIMAFWNAPLETPDHPTLAAEAGLRIRTALARFNDDPVMAGRQPIRMAVGLATGEACVGNIGSAQRFNYTVIGDTVNVAARLESACRHVGYDLLASDAAHHAGLATLHAGYVSLKGKSHRLAAHIVVGGSAVAGSDAFAELRRRHQAFVTAAAEGQGDEILTGLIAACAAVAPGVEPGLDEFYERLPARLDDYRA